MPAGGCKVPLRTRASCLLRRIVAERRSQCARKKLMREFQHLSGDLLWDIGVDPRDVPQPSNEVAQRLGLLDMGWQKPGKVQR